MKAVVDQNICTGCTLCTQTCPEVFKMEDDKAKAYVEIVPKEAEENAKKAAEECPVEAISIQE